jgi:hypothetical protein
MTHKKPLVPFGWWPGHWGLKGRTREIARAEYELDQAELEEKLLEINHRDDPDLLAQKKLELMLSSNNISPYDYARQIVILQTKESDAREIAMLDVDLKYEKISQLEYDRKKANILKEPWVSMPVINWDPNISQRTYFQLDYNEYFLEFLKANGYEGDEDTIINRWLNDICISIAEEINGLDADLITPTRRSIDTDNE